MLALARMLREDFLQQSAYHEVDRYCTAEKAYWMLKTVMDFHRHTQAALQSGLHLEQVVALPVVAEIARMRELSSEEAGTTIQSLIERARAAFTELGVES